MKYLSNNEGSVYERYYWPEYWGGYHCIECNWSVRAGDDGPVYFWIDYYGPSLGFLDPEIVITGIEKAPPLVKPAVVNSTIKQYAQAGATAGTLLGSVAAAGSMISCIAGRYALCGVFAGVGLGATYGAMFLLRIANDPFDPEYQYPFYNRTDEEWYANAYSWCYDVTYPYDDSNGLLPDFCNNFLYVSKITNGLLEAAAVVNDRVESCILMNDPCQEWQRDWLVYYLQQSGAWLNLLGLYHLSLGDYLTAIEYNDENDVTGETYRNGYWLREIAPQFMAAQ